MKKAKSILIILLVAMLVTASLPLCARAYTAAEYNVNGDKGVGGKAKIDVKDYVRAKNFAIGGSSFYSEVFMGSLRNIIIGTEKLPSQGSEIYLPEVP